MNTSALSFRDVHKSFRRHTALAGCTLTVNEGSITGLIGANGAGKSTLMSLAAGLLRADAGTIDVLGAPPARGHISHGVSYLAQHKPLYPSLTVAEMIQFGADTNDDWDNDYATTIATSTGIKPTTRIKHLSPGQRTIVAVALVLGRRPRLLMLDEPMADLDPLARRTVAQILMGDVAEHGTTILLSSHVLSEISDLADEMILLGHGQVHLQGSIDTIVASHYILTGTGDPHTVAGPATLIDTRGTTGLRGHLLRGDAPMIATSEWSLAPATLDDVVLGYLRSDASLEGALG
ncbi:ABC transporter ATP-binding protein [Hoyosella sp. G463]|uniref:ABC transporter ATP-binding protein n=1 Tax=Lolliginicoccus lacisalsi TaxID=2742202 RepID=A0A927J9Y6_9ACTN|nr:ABC transporter ATP-binding protein [Lolliginicoccus lacisalsi]MBD8505406.1 ABC transporter ATP-binding protein [Lolliginicoccus lacisalsi]